MDELLSTTIEVEKMLGEIGETPCMSFYKKRRKKNWH